MELKFFAQKECKIISWPLGYFEATLGKKRWICFKYFKSYLEISEDRSHLGKGGSCTNLCQLDGLKNLSVHRLDARVFSRYTESFETWLFNVLRLKSLDFYVMELVC